MTSSVNPNLQGMTDKEFDCMRHKYQHPVNVLNKDEEMIWSNADLIQKWNQYIEKITQILAQMYIQLRKQYPLRSWKFLNKHANKTWYKDFRLDEDLAINIWRHHGKEYLEEQKLDWKLLVPQSHDMSTEDLDHMSEEHKDNAIIQGLIQVARYGPDHEEYAENIARSRRAKHTEKKATQTGMVQHRETTGKQIPLLERDLTAWNSVIQTLMNIFVTNTPRTTDFGAYGSREFEVRPPFFLHKEEIGTDSNIVFENILSNYLHINSFVSCTLTVSSTNICMWNIKRNKLEDTHLKDLTFPETRDNIWQNVRFFQTVCIQTDMFILEISFVLSLNEKLEYPGQVFIQSFGFGANDNLIRYPDLLSDIKPLMELSKEEIETNISRSQNKAVSQNVSSTQDRDGKTFAQYANCKKREAIYKAVLALTNIDLDRQKRKTCLGLPIRIPWINEFFTSRICFMIQNCQTGIEKDYAECSPSYIALLQMQKYYSEYYEQCKQSLPKASVEERGKKTGEDLTCNILSVLQARISALEAMTSRLFYCM